uniref:C-type lectin domain-containing protein n=1 Tax=Neogobius melanostomus TaxID=47308 RepID=A0A8C6SQZ2_9GOBI
AESGRLSTTVKAMTEIERLHKHVSSLNYPLREYYYIDIGKPWYEAREYCRENYDDMAIFDNTEDFQLLSKPAGFSSVYAWIGLQDEPDEATNTKVFNTKPAGRIWIGLSRKPWHWVDGSPLTFNSWQGGAPFNSGTQYCVAEDNDHKWKAAECNDANPFICHKGKR